MIQFFYNRQTSLEIIHGTVHKKPTPTLANLPGSTGAEKTPLTTPETTVKRGSTDPLEKAYPEYSRRAFSFSVRIFFKKLF